MQTKEVVEYYAPNEQVRIYKPDMHPLERGVRLYCSQHKTAFELQIRGPLGIGGCGMKDGKSSIIANATLGIEQMQALRDSINAYLNE